jgi:hypothetical protein
MIEVMDRIKHLFAGQTNPAGEQYAVQKVRGMAAQMNLDVGAEGVIKVTGRQALPSHGIHLEMMQALELLFCRRVLKQYVRCSASSLL